MFLESKSAEALRAFAAEQPHPYRLLASDDRYLLVLEAVRPEVIEAGTQLAEVRAWTFELVEEGCRDA
ncbi:hypothetical protein ODE01S_08610 [Oceanithermus desulfurans NBRC 100063]|uniref:Uncharacterized protein n=1 Tax=Oceanithermus desulfurans NBRC 100063 TaxID=1227550 RepID=A0A511RK29_9DEIN|nr:hypothetical protein ODE01S_08610 [Oceanithermus desulfurans NBRC 100063]